ncbi:MAG TPA: hypothetical protein VLE22_26375, partial [Bryobacteraceae bacterium]|nr:hypothetical protein [Bryobacteraceae bacterium]
RDGGQPGRCGESHELSSSAFEIASRTGICREDGDPFSGGLRGISAGFPENVNLGNCNSKKYQGYVSMFQIIRADFR